MATTLEQYTCEIFGCNVEQLFLPGRHGEAVRSRQVCMWVMRKFTPASLDEIGEYFNRGHADVLYSLRNVNNLRDTNKVFKTQTDNILDTYSSLDVPFMLSDKKYFNCKVDNDEMIII
jgi:chromosomal replication initiator protein